MDPRHVSPKDREPLFGAGRRLRRRGRGPAGQGVLTTRLALSVAALVAAAPMPARTDADRCVPITSRFPKDLPAEMTFDLELSPNAKRSGEGPVCHVTLGKDGTAQVDGCDPLAGWVIGEGGPVEKGWSWARSAGELVLRLEYEMVQPRGCAEVYCRQECAGVEDGGECMRRCTEPCATGAPTEETPGAVRFAMRATRDRSGRWSVRVAEGTDPDRASADYVAREQEVCILPK